ncbi:hypothetical protein QNI19_37655 [Cytophagaceae bacterium DM2B3-1]|uniref:Uncharacterized protein n=1 Tax=Xanthocytophaga flava TaxID=3048013 RepID=A0ABT7CY63_9BACT|nr:hypothetical protein [Xanthocytophaga flavus]
MRQLIINSEYCIAGKVLDIKTKQEYIQPLDDKKADGFTRTDYFAQVLITEVFKGSKHAQDTISISFNPNMVCPGPDVYNKDTEVITFLDQSSTDTLFRTHSLSYGVKTISNAQEMQWYKTLIRQMQIILTYPNVVQRQQETIEWLVRCAENYKTRWDGIYELKQGSEFMVAYNMTPLLEVQRNERGLNSIQKQRLYNYFVQTNISTLSYWDFTLLELALESDKKKIKELLKKYISKIAYSSEVALYVMNYYGTLINNKHLYITSDEFQEALSATNHNPEKASLIWNTFVAQVQNTP